MLRASLFFPFVLGQLAVVNELNLPVKKEKKEGMIVLFLLG